MQTGQNWATLVSTYRERNGLLQKQIAADLGVDVMTVSRWERGLSEPSKAQKGRLKDLMMLGRDPADLPFVLQQLRVGKSVAVINLASGRYIATKDTDNLSGQGDLARRGACAVTAIRNASVRAALENAGGLPGMLRSGVVSYSFVTRRQTGQGIDTVETDASILRFQGFEPFIVLHRRRIEKPVTLDQVDMVYEGDLAEL